MSNKSIKKSPIVSAAVTAANVMFENKNYLDDIILENFRGYLKQTRINFGKKITLFFGKGSAGKSTVLDAINCLGQSNIDNEDLTGLKLKHILHKKSSSKNFMLGLGVVRNDSKRVIKKTFVKDGYAFRPSFIELASPSEDPENIKNHIFVGIAPKNIPEKIKKNFDIDRLKFYGADITYCENEYAFKELWEHTYKHTEKLIKYLDLCLDFANKFTAINNRINEENKKEIRDMVALKKAQDAMDSFLEAQTVDTFAFTPLKFIFTNTAKIKNHQGFLKRGKGTYKGFLKYISDDIKKEKKFLYKNNKLYGREELSSDGIQSFFRSKDEGRISIVQDWDTFADFLCHSLTLLMSDPREQENFPQKHTFSWGKQSKILGTKTMFNVCGSFIKSTLNNIKTVKHIEKLQMVANMSGMHSLVEDAHALIEDNQKEINKWLAEFEYDFKVSVERTGLSEETEIVHKKHGSKIPSTQGGSGIEYLLTFLSTCIDSKQKILLLEEPEKALHSRMQVNLAKFFVENSKKNQLIIETHSENLLLGILKHVRDGKISPEDIKVNYVYMENGESKVDELDVNKQGSFNSKWRDGFFTEKLDLI